MTHKYGTDIDDTLVYRHLQNELEWIVIFLREVRQSLADEPPDAE